MKTRTTTIIGRETPWGDAISIDEVQIQNIKGANAELVQEAIEAGLSRVPGRTLNPSAGTTQGDTIAVVVIEAIRDVIYTHRIIARIQTNANSLAITVNTSARHATRGGEYPVPESVPKGLYDTLIAQLKK